MWPGRAADTPGAPTTKRINLVLQGGGAHGAFTCGVSLSTCLATSAWWWTRRLAGRASAGPQSWPAPSMPPGCLWNTFWAGRYRIHDPLLFYQTVSTTEGANSRLSTLLNAALRRVLGEATLTHVVRDDRAALMLRVKEQLNREAQAFGITREYDNEKDLTSIRSNLIIVDDAFRPRRVEITPRIGITKAVAHPLRYIIAGNKFVSKL